jgi:hypothetical protein
MSSIPKDWKPVRGATYRIKEELKEMGARWDRDTSLWWVHPARLQDAEELVRERG